MINNKKIFLVSKKNWCCGMISNGIKIWIFYSLISSIQCIDEFDIDKGKYKFI